MEPVKVGLLGLGTVGGGTATVLSRNAEEIARRAGRGIIIDYAAALDTSNAATLGLSSARLSNNALDVVEDPVVSSDVIGNSNSLLFDTKGTIKAGSNMIKTLSWYENLGHAARLLDVVRLYGELDQRQEAEQ